MVWYGMLCYCSLQLYFYFFVCSRSDLAYFDGLSETILCAGLVKPKPGKCILYVLSRAMFSLNQLN